MPGRCADVSISQLELRRIPDVQKDNFQPNIKRRLLKKATHLYESARFFEELSRMCRAVIQEKKSPEMSGTCQLALCTLLYFHIYLAVMQVFGVCPDCQTKFPIRTIKLTETKGPFISRCIYFANRRGTAHICPVLSVRHDKFTSHLCTKTPSSQNGGSER